MADLKNVEIFAVGTWNGFKFVQEDLPQIISNTNILMKKGELKPRIKLGHSSNQILEGQTDGDPALGTPGNFRIKKDKIISDFSNLPDMILESIKKERFTSVSVELDHVKHFGWFLTAVSLLGADIPAVKTINDLQKFLSESDNDSYTLNSDIKLACSEPVLINEPNNKGIKKMGENDKNILTLEFEKRELEAKLKEMEMKKKDADSQLSKFKEQEQYRTFMEQKDKVLDPYRKQVKEGKLQPSIMTKLETAIDSQRQSFSDDLPLMIPVNMISEITAAYSDQLSQKETGTNNTGDNSEVDIDARVTIEVNKVIAATNMNYSDAAEAVFAANPALGNEYVEWTNKISYGEV